MSALSIYAGPGAYQTIKQYGLPPEQVKVVVGAAGGPKWFVLYGLDRFLFGEFFARRKQVLVTMGSSAGAWRLACLAMNEPLVAIERMAKLYSSERYSDRPDSREITYKASVLLDNILGQNGAREIVENALIKTHFVTNRCRGAIATNRLTLGGGLAACAVANAISRRSLSLFLERTVMSNMGAESPFASLTDLATANIALTIENLAPALLASGSVPFALDGVRNIVGGKAGVYLDGGLTDYHFDIPFIQGEGVVLYPHFSKRVIPGWFDKNLGWRRPNPLNYHNVLLLAPSDEFIASLPYAKIPDRSDVKRFSYEQRLTYWHTVLDASEQLAVEFAHWLQNGASIDKVLPLTG